jgi:RHS repeat-associated protein
MKQLRQSAPLAALVLGLLIAGAAQAATATRTSAFEYDPVSGLLTREIIEPDNPQLRLETAYSYDAYGNKIAATVSSPATGSAAIAARTSSSTYDSQGQFPITSSNALGQSESKTYDPRFGTLTSLTGPNGLTTQWQYDDFGRKVREIRADGNQTQWDYLYCSGINGGTAACPALATYLVQVTPLAADGTPNGAWSKTYYDALDRAIQSETVGFDGSSTIVKNTEYDSLGRVSRVSLPHYAGQPVQWTTMTYDAIGRVIATTAPDNTQTTAAYNGLSSSITNALGQTQTKVKNSQGQTVRVTDPLNNSLSYQYDPFGNLTQTIDPNGNIVTLSYDLRGRKTQMVDPDMGTWTYDYDVLGQLTKQTDAKGQVTSMTYDLLGRMTGRAEPDLVSNWSYDNCAKGIGKLCHASTDNGYSRTPHYDSVGRADQTATTIDTGYTDSVSYDANGRVATRTWPTGFTVKYVYTALGYLKEVRNAATDALYWRADTMDAQGHLLQQTWGNNIVTQQVFDAATGRISNIYAGAGNGVQNLSYSYDSLGNLLARNDGNQNLNETFLYDSLNRLTTATVNANATGVVSTSYGYDSLGNITSRSDFGSYTYGVTNHRPHALTDIALTHGGKRQYTYDANGNLSQEVQLDASGNVISDKGRVEVYTSFNMPQALGAPGISLAFAYNSEHQRVKQIAPAATTIYLNPDASGGLFYEKDLKADGSTEHRHFLMAGGQTIAIVKQITSSSTGTGTVGATTTGTTTTTTTVYLHRDSLGSTSAVTNDAGAVIERLAYEPFGKRRAPAGTTDPDNTIVGVNTDRGYTNHEHLDELGLIHMNGRIYDPMAARFMSADPLIQAPDNLQNYNRYAYVLNSPFLYTDPTGFSFFSSLKRAVTGNFSGVSGDHLKDVASPNRIILKNMSYQNGQMYVAIGSYFCGPAAYLCAAAGSYENASVHGASFGQAAKAGAISLATSGAFYAVGSISPGWGQAGATAESIFGNVVGHAVVGCASALASGGGCGAGALSAGLPAAVGDVGLIGAMVVGGTASAIGGGKFANGAVTAAYGYLFNNCGHDSKGCSFWGRVNERYTNTSNTIDSVIDNALPWPINRPEGLATAVGGGMAAKDYGGKTVLQEGVKLASEYKNTPFSLFRTVARPDIVRIGATTAVNAIAVNVAWKGGLYVGSIISEAISGTK